MNIAWIAWSFHKPFHFNVRICVCPCYYKTKSTITISNITLRGHSLFPRSCQLLYAGRHCGTNWIIFFHEDYHPLEEKVMLLWDFFPLIFFFFLWWKGKAPLLSNLCQRLIHWKIASLVLALSPLELHLIVSTGRLLHTHDSHGQKLFWLFWFQITYINHCSDYYFQYLKSIFLIL